MYWPVVAGGGGEGLTCSGESTDRVRRGGGRGCVLVSGLWSMHHWHSSAMSGCFVLKWSMFIGLSAAETSLWSLVTGQ